MATRDLPSRPKEATSSNRKRDKLSSFFKPKPEKDTLNSPRSPILQPASSSPELLNTEGSHPASETRSSRASAADIAEHHPAKVDSHQLQGEIPQQPQQTSSEEGHGLQAGNGAKRGKAYQSKDLWEHAFQRLREREPSIVEEFEKQLALIAHIGDAHKTPKLDLALIETIVKQKSDDREAKRLVFQVGEMHIKIRAVGEKIIRAILWSNTFIGAALSSQPYASLAWSGVSILLPLLLNSAKQNLAMVDGLENITHLMQLYKIREALYLWDANASVPPDFVTALVEIYSAILEYEVRAINHLSKNSFGRGVNATIERDDWNALLAKVQIADQRCTAFTSLIDTGRETQEISLITTSNDIQSQMLSMFQLFQEERQRNRQNDQEKELLQSLASDYKTEKDFVPLRINGTCEWFFGDKRYTDWRDSNASSLLWVSAGPGCGKSVLARALIDERRLSKTTMTSSVCYFFFKEGQESRAYGANALSAMLHQLFFNSNLIHHGLSCFKQYGPKLSSMSSVMWEVLINACKDPDAGEIVCVIDALDECGETSRQQFMDNLIQFFSSREFGGSDSSCVKFLVTSRPYDDLESKFEHLSSASSYMRFDGDEKSEQISHEINLVIDVKVKTFARSFKTKDQQMIAERLKKMENRTYLWLFLTIDIIERSRSKYAKLSSIEKLLADLPLQVSEAYEKILSRSSDKENAKKLLQIIVAATRPLTLMEANAALTLAIQNPKPTSLEDLDLWPKEDFLSTVKNMCGLLVTIHDSRLSLLHQTARDFLTVKSDQNASDNLERWRGCLDLACAHSLLCLVCINYIKLQISPKGSTRQERAEPEGLDNNHSGDKDLDNGLLEVRGLEGKDSLENQDFDNDDEDFDDDDEDSDDDDEDSDFNHEGKDLNKEISGSFRWADRLARRDSLCAYSGRNWPVHYKGQDEEQRPLLQSAAEQLCDARNESFVIWYRQFTDDEFTYGQIVETWTKTEVAAYLGLTDLVEKFLNDGDDVNAVWNNPEYLRSSRTALLFASANGYADIVRLVLERGANPWQTTDDENAITLASVGGHNEILQLLYDSGVSVDCQPKQGPTALKRVILMRGRASTVSFLVEKGADIHARDPVYHETALQLACHRGDKRTVEYLIASGADLNAPGDYDGAAFHIACKRADLEVVKLLCSKGADMMAMGYKYGSALQAACAGYDKLKTVQFLIDQGLDVNARGGPHGSPLNAACSDRRNLGVVKILIASGANVNAMCAGRRQTPLTPLQIASRDSCRDIAEFLIKSGAYLEAENDEYGTALQIACGSFFYEDQDILTLLIEKGANVNATAGLHGTALQKLCRDRLPHYCYPINRVKLLIEAGADFNARAGNWGSPLHCALKSNDRDIVELLKAYGAIDIEGEEGS